MFKARITYSLFYFTIKRTLGFFVRGPRPNALRDYTFLSQYNCFSASQLSILPCSHHLHHHNIHLVTQHQDRLVSRSVLKSLHPRQREPCGRDRSFLGPQSTDQKSGERIYIHIRTKPRMAPRPRVGTPSHTSPSQKDTCSPKKPSAH